MDGDKQLRWSNIFLPEQLYVKWDTWSHPSQQMLLISSMAGKRLCLESTYSAGLTKAGDAIWSHVCCSHLHCCTVTAQLFWIASVLNLPIYWMKQIWGAKQERKRPFFCQTLVYAKDLHNNTGPKYLSERVEAQVGYWVLLATPNLPGFS